MSAQHLSQRRTVGALFLLGTFLILVGCKGKPVGSVSGKVTYKDKPVTAGEVQLFAPEKGIGANAPLDSSGNFTISTSIDVGTYKVYIQPSPPQQLPPGKEPPKKETLSIPKKYQDLKTTPLSVEVKPGPNNFPLALTD